MILCRNERNDTKKDNKFLNTKKNEKWIVFISCFLFFSILGLKNIDSYMPCSPVVFFRLRCCTPWWEGWPWISCSSSSRWAALRCMIFWYDYASSYFCAMRLTVCVGPPSIKQNITHQPKKMIKKYILKMTSKIKILYPVAVIPAGCDVNDGIQILLQTLIRWQENFLRNLVPILGTSSRKKIQNI